MTVDELKEVENVFNKTYTAPFPNAKIQSNAPRIVSTNLFFS